MNKYTLRFWFDYGGICFWGMNDLAKNRFGYAIENSRLPLSDTLISKLNSMQEEFETFLDLENSTSTSNWTENHRLTFLDNANEICVGIQKELGSDFEIINDVLKNMV